MDYYNTILQGLMDTFPDEYEEKLSVYLSGTFSSDLELEVLAFVRSKEHFVKMSEIVSETGTVREDVIDVVKNLLEKKMLRQDSRTRRYSVDDDNAGFYTDESNRELVNYVLLQKQEYKDLLKYAPIIDEDNEELDVRRYVEGNKQEIITVRYERDLRCRRKAIQIHGLSCQVCGFNFEQVYGEIGKGYIEVHHVSQLHTIGRATEIDPEIDLVCLCANCHRMIHHKRNQIMPVKDLVKVYSDQKKKISYSQTDKPSSIERAKDFRWL